MEKTIVVIDNNFVVREVLKSLLTVLSRENNEKINLYSSQNGIEGLGFVYITQPEVIIIDMTLPKYSGNELLYFLLSNKKYHTENQKIIVLTEEERKLKLPRNFTVLSKDKKDFLPELFDLICTHLKYSPLNNKKLSIFKRLVGLANKIDTLQDKFSKSSLLSKLFILPQLLFLEVIVSILVSVLFIVKGRTTDSNIKQNKRDLSLLRRRYYPTIIGGSIFSMFSIILAISLLFTQKVLFQGVQEDSKAFGYGELAWYSTMDSTNDVTNPVEGTAGQVLNGVSFDTEVFDMGDNGSYEIKSAKFDGANQVIKINSPLQNQDYSLDTGTIEFMYSPAEDNTTNKEMTFFSLYGDDNNKIEFKKLNDVDNNLSLKYICDLCTNNELLISGANYAFESESWIQFTVHWDAYAPLGEQLQIELNGAYLEKTIGANINPGAITPLTAIFIGNSSASGTNHANGRIDDFKIYLGAPKPSSTPIGTPAPTIVYKQDSGQPSWHSTMNNIWELSVPEFGSEAPAKLSGALFAPGPIGLGSGTYYDSGGQSVYVDIMPGIHYSLNQGAVELYYKPNFDPTENTEINIFSIRQNDDEEIRLFKKDNLGQNQLVFSFSCGVNCGGEEIIEIDDFDDYWKANEWMFIRLTWNDKPSLQLEDQLNIYLNGVQPPHIDQQYKIAGENISTSPTLPVLYIGNRTIDGANSAMGVIDEFKIFSTTIIPTPTPTSPPTAIPTPSMTPVPSIVPTTTPTPLWYSTLDSVSAITTPAYGQPGTVGKGVGFVSGSPFVSDSPTNKGIKFFWVKDHSSNVSVSMNNNSINESKGRITFHYKPMEGVFGGKTYDVFNLKIDKNNFIRLHYNRIPNYLSFEYVAKAGGVNNYNILKVEPPNYDWIAGEWVYLELNYDISKPQEQQLTLHYSVQGGPLIEPIHTHTGTISTSLGQVPELIIGAKDMSYPIGYIDDFALYGYNNVLPTATPTPTGLLTPTPIPTQTDLLFHSTLYTSPALKIPEVGPTAKTISKVTPGVVGGTPSSRQGTNFPAADSLYEFNFNETYYTKQQGRIEFWYKPNVAYNSGGNLGFFRIRGQVFDKIDLHRTGAYNLDFLYDARCQVAGYSCDDPNGHQGNPAGWTRRLRIPTANFQNYWVVNKWIKFEVLWNYYESNENDKLKIFITYHDGTNWQTTELTGTHTGVMTPEQFDNQILLYIGSANYTAKEGVKGVMSDFKIYGTGVRETPTPTVTPIPKSQVDPIWYSTLDNASALTTPVVGKGATSSNVTFELGAFGSGARIDASSEHITVASLPSTDFYKDKGAIEFYYKPDESASTNKAIHLFNIQNDSNNRLRMYKTNTASSPIYVSYTHSGTSRTLTIPYNNFKDYWESGKWILFRVEWDNRKTATESLRVYMNSIRPTATPPGAVFSEFTGTPNLYIGNITNTGSEFARGVIDEFTIFGDPDSRRLIVDDLGDGEDDDVGDGICATSEGACTLRAAIQEANSTDAPDWIAFNIPGSGPHIISITNPLPAITKRLKLDGTTQPGTDCSNSSLKIIIAGTSYANSGFIFEGVDRNELKGLVIYGFARGISINSSNENILKCNIIGLDVDGTTSKGNTQYGIYISDGSEDNIIGGLDNSGRNVISSNNVGVGIINSYNTSLYGNFIGVDKSGVLAKGNYIGVRVKGSTNTVIGNSVNEIPSSCVNGCNVISGNSSYAVSFDEDTQTNDSNTIQYNYIGTDINGSSPLPNLDGIKFAKSNSNTIKYNVLNSNSINIYVYSKVGANLTNYNISNNHIGVDKVASSKLSDSTYGIAVFASNSSTISSIDIKDNIIGGAVRGSGIYAYGTGISNLNIQSNYIGTNSGSDNLGNKYGVHFLNPNSSTIKIGGDNLSLGNEIAHNALHGVYLSNSSNILTKNNKIYSNGGDGITVLNSAVNNTIIENSIYSNEGLGIKLRSTQNVGVTYNDGGDGDTGPNNLQNYPVIIKALYDGTNLSLYGGFQSEVGKYYRLDFYSNSTPDESGFGEGENHIYTILSRSGSLYDFSVTPLVITTTLPPNHKYISATATECGEQACTTLLSTSEFGLTGFDGAFVGKNISITDSTGGNKLFITGDGQKSIPDIFTFNLQNNGTLSFYQSINTPGLSPVNAVGLDARYYAVAGTSESYQYRVYTYSEGLRCNYNLGASNRVYDLKVETQGSRRDIYVASDTTGKQLTVIQGKGGGQNIETVGEYLSEVRDMGIPVRYYYAVTWSENWSNFTQAQKDGSSAKVRLQIRSGDDTTSIYNSDWYGPDGTTSSYYEVTSGNNSDVIPDIVQGKRYLQYRLILLSDTELKMSPALDAITIRYEPL